MAQGKTAYITDFDDTLVNTSTRTPITPIVNAVKLAQSKGFLIFVITARSTDARHLTFQECYCIGINPDNVFTSLYYGRDPPNFKKMLMEKKMKRKMEKKMKKKMMLGFYGVAILFCIVLGVYMVSIHFC